MNTHMVNVELFIMELWCAGNDIALKLEKGKFKTNKNRLAFTKQALNLKNFFSKIKL